MHSVTFVFVAVTAEASFAGRLLEDLWRRQPGESCRPNRRENKESSDIEARTSKPGLGRLFGEFRRFLDDSWVSLGRSGASQKNAETKDAPAEAARRRLMKAHCEEDDDRNSKLWRIHHIMRNYVLSAITASIQKLNNYRMVPNYGQHLRAPRRRLQEEEDDKYVVQWKLRKLIQELDQLRGAGPSAMVTLIIRAGDPIRQSIDLINAEQSEGSCVKSRSNREYITTMLAKTLHNLRQYKQTPKNGLVIYNGVVLDAKGKEREMHYEFEPFRPIGIKLYYNTNHFKTDPLRELLTDESTFGFIIISGSGALFGTLCGSRREVIHQFEVQLPKKHGRGGQSSVRFARLRVEKRNNYVRKVAEQAQHLFLPAGDQPPNIVGLVIGGPADFKTELAQSKLFEPKLEQIIVQPMLDLAYGGENGFVQAIEMASGALGDAKLVAERRVISKLLDEMGHEGGKYAFGVEDTLMALQNGAAEFMLVWEELPLRRVEVIKMGSDQTEIKHVSPSEADLLHKANEKELSVMSDIPFVDWVVENYKDFGTRLELVSQNSPEGMQFCQGLGGVGAVLRFPLDFNEEKNAAGDNAEEAAEVRKIFSR